MNPIAEIVKRHITASHMTLQEKKCVIAGRQVSQIANPVFAVVDTNTDGIIIMGNPIGSETYCYNERDRIARTQMKSCEMLHELPEHVAYAVLKYCINARPVYMVRINPPSRMKDHMTHFDSVINDSLYRLAVSAHPGTHRSREINETIALISRIRTLPRDLSGLNIHSLAGLFGQKAYQESLAFFVEKTAKTFRSLHVNLHFVYPSETVRLPDTLLSNAGLPPDIRNDVSGCIKLAHEYEWSMVRADLLDRGSREKSAEFISNRFEGSGGWSTVMRIVYHSLSAKQFRETLRLRLLISPLYGYTVGPPSFRCPVCTTYTIDSEERSYHFLCCDRHGSFTARHNFIRDKTIKLVEDCTDKNDRILRPDPNVTDAQVAKNPPTRKADLEFRYIPAEFHVIVDFVVSEVCGQVMTEGITGSHTTADFANDKKEEEKNGRYSMFTPAFKKEFAPFAVESTGRIGKAAHQLLDTLAKSQICSPFLVNILKRDISLEMLKFRANLVISNRMKLQIAPVYRRSVPRLNLPPIAEYPLIVANQVDVVDMTLVTEPILSSDI